METSRSVAVANETVMTAGSPEGTEAFEKDFIPYIIKWGRGTNLLGVLLCFGPAVALALQGIFPPWGAFLAASAIQAPLTFRLYFQEIIQYFGIIGIPGSSMSFLSGNISNLRLPACAVAQSAAGVEGGTEEGTVIGTIGIAVSTFVNIAILTVGVLLGAYTLSLLPAKVTAALNLLLPGLFAALTANYCTQNFKIAAVGLPIALAMVIVSKYGMLSFLPPVLSASIPVLTAVFGTMAIGIVWAKSGKL